MRGIDYPALYKWVYSRPRLLQTLLHLDRLIVVFVSVAYLTSVSFCFFFDSPLTALFYIIVSGVSFAAVTFMRRLINAKRPYEIYSFEELGIEPPSRKLGRAFPSRHTFSAFLIGVLLLKLMMPLGCVVLALGFVIAVCRVLFGAHTVKDVIVGMILGAVMGALGVLGVNLL